MTSNISSGVAPGREWGIFMNFCLSVLKDKGYEVGKDSFIVDFGCGEGRRVRTLRERGYNAVGCDIFDNLERQRNTPHTKEMVEKGHILPIDTTPYRLPFEDESVDFVYSTTVFEHVENCAETVAELARILKPGGAMFHHFPAKYSLIEQHLYIPFGGVIRSYPYLCLWALLGWRKYYQKGVPAFEKARQNYRLLHNTTFYRSEGELRALFGKHFPRVNFVEDSYFRVTDSRKARMLGRVSRYVPGIPKIYRTFWANALLAGR